jgi:hypothetical protein
MLLTGCLLAYCSSRQSSLDIIAYIWPGCVNIVIHLLDVRKTISHSITITKDPVHNLSFMQ